MKNYITVSFFVLFVLNVQSQNPDLFKQLHEPIKTKNFEQIGLNSDGVLFGISQKDAPNDKEGLQDYSVNAIKDGKVSNIINGQGKYLKKMFFDEIFVVSKHKYFPITNKTGPYDRFNSLAFEVFNYSGKKLNEIEIKEVNRRTYIHTPADYQKHGILTTSIKTNDGQIIMGVIGAYEGKYDYNLSVRNTNVRVNKISAPNIEWFQKHEFFLLKISHNGKKQWIKRFALNGNLPDVSFYKNLKYQEGFVVFNGNGGQKHDVFYFDKNGELLKKEKWEGLSNKFKETLYRKERGYTFSFKTVKNKDSKKNKKPKKQDYLTTYNNSNEKISDTMISEDAFVTGSIIRAEEAFKSVVVIYKTSKKKVEDKYYMSVFDKNLKRIKHYELSNFGKTKTKNLTIIERDDLLIIKNKKFINIYNKEFNLIWQHNSLDASLGNYLLFEKGHLVFFDNSYLHHYKKN